MSAAPIPGDQGRPATATVTETSVHQVDGLPVDLSARDVLRLLRFEVDAMFAAGVTR